MSYYTSQAPMYGATEGHGWQPVPYVAQPPVPVMTALPSASIASHGYHSAVASAPVARTAPVQQSQAETQGAGSWPQALRRYVERAFASTAEGEERQRLQMRLKEVIAAAQQRGELWTRNWDSFPLPELASNAPAHSANSIHRPQYQSAAYSRSDSDEAERSNKRIRSPAFVPAKTKKKTKSQKKIKREDQEAWSAHALAYSQAREKARARRFGDGSALGATAGWSQEKVRDAGSGYRSDVTANSVESESKHGLSVKGTSRDLEKGYFRLTSKPDPASVRPEGVLRDALDRLVGLLQRKQVNYFYAGDQFKGMRQDCTVQHIRNALSASIYEAHARSALEHGDIGEYNQCQGQLLQHYSAGVEGCRAEFQAYRVLYQAVHASRDNRAAVLLCLQSLSVQDTNSSAVEHALRAREALAAGDFVKVCALYRTAPHMGRALFDIVMPKIRFGALKLLVKVFAPLLPVETVAAWLGFHAPDSHSAGQDGATPPSGPLPGSTQPAFWGRHGPAASARAGFQECRDWLIERNARLVTSPGEGGELCLDCKQSSQLREPAVADPQAGGPDLALDDFLTKASIAMR